MRGVGVIVRAVSLSHSTAQSVASGLISAIYDGRGHVAKFGFQPGLKNLSDVFDTKIDTLERTPVPFAHFKW